MTNEPEVVEVKEEEVKETPQDNSQKEEVVTSAELRKQAVDLGFPQEEANKILAKSVLTAIIKSLKSTKSDVTEASVPTAQIQKEDAQAEKLWRSKVEKQWAYWDGQPKMSILVPLNGKETQGKVNWVFDKRLNREVPIHVGGAAQSVIENGAVYYVPKGVYTEVPQPIGKLIQEKFQQTSDAGKNFLVDRQDPTTGRSVRDNL